MRIIRRLLFLLCGVVFLFSSHNAFAQVSLPDGFTHHLVAGGLTTPVAMEFSPDGRLFMTEKSGQVRIIKNGALLEEPFLTVSVNDFSERGLLGITFDPDFETNRYVYLYYTRTSEPIKNRVSRFTASETNPDVAEEGSELILLDDISSDAGNHNAGALHFGLDGKLYISTGDGGQTATKAQDLNSLSGKILRINKDGSVPTDNPFFDTPDARSEIWALGLRNPFTFAFHPMLDKLMINDVGANVWEEVNMGAKSANYGWPVCEGVCDNPAFVNPIYQNYHPEMVSITGASFYTGDSFPTEYKNHYFFGDYVKNYIKKLDYTAGNAVTNFATGVNSPVDIREGPDGALYYLSIGDGAVYKIVYGGSTPTPSLTPSVTPDENQPPQVNILAPVATDKYNAGETIHYLGEATDPEDGALPASAFSWTIIFHHDTHTHPFMGPITGATEGDFQIPQTGEPSANVWYEIRLTVTDSDGEQATKSLEISPHKSELTLQTEPEGLQVTLNGQPVSDSHSIESVVGFEHILGVVSPQTVAGRTYEFVGWSDGQAQSHTIEMPASDTTYTATFQDVTLQGNGLLGTYFTRDDFSGLTAQRIDPTIDFDWEMNQPASGITPQYYSARWEGQLFIPTDGEYTFYTNTDDGVRLWINGESVIDKWQDQAATEYEGKITLKGGKNYDIRMDYYNAPWVGSAKLSWSGPGIAKQIIPRPYLYSNASTIGDGLLGKYFDDMTLTTLKKERVDNQINFDWGTGEPITGVDADTFSVRWTGYLIPQFSQEYTFRTTTDDGVRLWINHEKVIDKWQDQSATAHEGKILLQADIKYPVTLEYYENRWDAVSKLSWQSASQSLEVIPQERLFSR